MVAEQSWADGMRADALAKLFLTRFDNVDVVTMTQRGRDVGYDYLVRVDRGDTPGVLEFGVEIKAVRNTPANRVKSSRFQVNAEAIKNSDLPVVLFVFDVDNETGFYRWLNEPVVEQDDSATLRRDGDGLATQDANRTVPIPFASLQTLDNVAMNGILQRVAEWNMARFRSISTAQSSD